MRRREPVFNSRRRTIIKYGLFGAAAFALGKVLGPSLNFFGDSATLGDDKITDFKNFRVVENGKELGFFDNLGNEILIMEKD